MLPIVFARSVVVSRSLDHTTLHSIRNTSLAFSLVPFPRVLRECFSSVESFFCRCYPLLYFLTAFHITTDITPQLFEAAHLFDGFIFNSHVYFLWFYSDNQRLRLTYISSSYNPLICHSAPSACSSASFHLLLAKPYHRQILCN